MALRKAKAMLPDNFSNCYVEKAEMIRRVEVLHQQIDSIPMRNTTPEVFRDDVQYCVELCYADLCEIAGVEREPENET